MKDSKKVPKEKLKEILYNWLKKREANDKVDKDYFFNLIENNFNGVDIAETIYVNGIPSTITAGWKIPNSNNYYSGRHVVLEPYQLFLQRVHFYNNYYILF